MMLGQLYIPMGKQLKIHPITPYTRARPAGWQIEMLKVKYVAKSLFNYYHSPSVLHFGCFYVYNCLWVQWPLLILPCPVTVKLTQWILRFTYCLFQFLNFPLIGEVSQYNQKLSHVMFYCSYKSPRSHQRLQILISP